MQIIPINLLRNFSKINTAAQRFALMIVAVPTSYVVDTYFSGANNEETKANARIKNVSKALACGIVGVAVRLLADFGFNKFTQIGDIKTDGIFVESAKPKKVWGSLLPKLEQRTKGMTVEALKTRKNKYILVGSNVFAAVTMVFTNVLLDAPLTKFFTNIGIDKFGYPAKKEGASNENA